MHEEAKIQDLFPAPHPFDMECGGAARRTRKSSSQGSSAHRVLRHLDHSYQPNAIVALALVVLLAIAFAVGAINSNLSSGTSHALWAADNASDSPEDDIAQNMPTPSQAEEDQ